MSNQDAAGRAASCWRSRRRLVLKKEHPGRAITFSRTSDFHHDIPSRARRKRLRSRPFTDTPRHAGNHLIYQPHRSHHRQNKGVVSSNVRSPGVNLVRYVYPHTWGRTGMSAPAEERKLDSDRNERAEPDELLTSSPPCYHIPTLRRGGNPFPPFHCHAPPRRCPPIRPAPGSSPAKKILHRVIDRSLTGRNLADDSTLTQGDGQGYPPLRWEEHVPQRGWTVRNAWIACS